MDKQAQGKKNRKSGSQFELKVRKDIENKGWICAKWTNNVEFHNDEDIHELLFKVGKLIPAKRKYNPFMKALSIGNGFPDFICFKNVEWDNPDLSPMSKYFRYYDIIGVEAKSNGYLTKEEREKCNWLLDNNIFSKIFIVQKGLKRGKIIYKEFNQG